MRSKITPHDYLRPSQSAFWRWQEGGNVATWADGPTITFREELRQVLQRHVDRGLPSLGSVLLLLAATRDGWSDLSNDGNVLTHISPAFDEEAAHEVMLTEVQLGLDMIARFDADLRRSTAAKVELIDMVLSDCWTRTSPQVAATVLEYLRHPLEESISDPASSADNSGWALIGPVEIEGDIAQLGDGLSRVDADSLRLRMRTGLESEIRAPEIDLSPAEQIRALLGELQDDERLGGVARLAHDLMAAVTLPRKVSQHDELPLGGVSDITNRGPLDRLLLSELAHDDLTLAVRVAVGEALYLRRESSPRTPPRTRAIVLDGGLRTWGVPRVFITSVALAMAATTDARDEILTWRAHGGSLEPIELLHREGLLHHLEQLSADIHPGAALAELTSRMQKLDSDCEAVLITTADTLADRDFLKTLAQCEAAALFIASVDRDGTYRLLHYSGQGKRVVREAKLDLDQLFSQRGKASSLIDPKGRDDLPAIFSVQPFPLLLSHAVEPKRSWLLDNNTVLSATKDKRLMHWNRAGWGAYQIADTLPGGLPQWHSRVRYDNGQETWAILGATSQGELNLLDICIDVDDLQYKAISLPVSSKGVKAISSHNGALMVILSHRVYIFQPGDWETSRTLEIPVDAVWKRDRFFQSQHSGLWLALAYDGVEARLEHVTPAQTGKDYPKLVGLFDRVGHDGPWGVTVKGHLYDSATDSLYDSTTGMDGNVELLAANRQGNRVIVGRHSPEVGHLRNYQFRIDVDTREAAGCRGNPEEVIDFVAIERIARQRPLRSRIVSIFEDNGLVLTSQKGARHRLMFSGHCIQLQYGAVITHASPQRFEPYVLPEGFGIQLHRAELADGTEAFLDSRGLLHLRPVDREMPEVTLVLDERHVSGWSSDGGVWGLAYFTGQKRDSKPTGSCYQLLKRFVRGLS